MGLQGLGTKVARIMDQGCTNVKLRYWEAWWTNR